MVDRAIEHSMVELPINEADIRVWLGEHSKYSPDELKHGLITVDGKAVDISRVRVSAQVDNDPHGMRARREGLRLAEARRNGEV